MISGGAGLIFKGSGFYETDYKRKSDGNGRKHYKPTETVPQKTVKSDTSSEK